MPDLDDLLAQLDRSADEILSVHRDLVSIPSVNTGFMPTGNETPVCEYTRDLLARGRHFCRDSGVGPGPREPALRAGGRIRQAGTDVHVPH